MASDDSDELDAKIKKLDLERREEEIKQLKSRNKLSWMTPATVLSLIPLLGVLGAWTLNEIKQYNESYRALNKVAGLEVTRDKLVEEIEKRKTELSNQKNDLNTEILTLIAQKSDYRDEANRERSANQKLAMESQQLREKKEELASEVSKLAVEFRSLQYLKDALEATSIDDSRATMTLLHVVRQSYEEKDDSAKRYAMHVVKKVLLVQTLGRIAFSSGRARTAAMDNWKPVEEFLRQVPWFDNFLNDHQEPIRLITSDDGKPAEVRQSLLRISQDLRAAIAQTGAEDKYLNPIRPMKARWFDQAQRAAEKLATAAQEGRRFEEVQLYSNQFWRMYCCELVLVEEGGLATAMVRFGKVLDEWEGHNKGFAPDSVLNVIQERLEQLKEAARNEDNDSAELP